MIPDGSLGTALAPLVSIDEECPRCADERAQEMAGGDVFRLAAVVHECSPLCCFVGDEALEPLYREAGKTPPTKRKAA